VVTVTQPGDPSSLPAPPVCGSSHPGTTVPSSYVETTYAKLMAGLQAIEPQSLAKIVATYKNGGSVSQLITDLGQAITVGVSSTLSRIGGVITSLATGALDPDVWNGVKALYDAANEANPPFVGKIKLSPGDASGKRTLICSSRPEAGVAGSGKLPLKHGQAVTLGDPLQ
jgi:hypothetical protein